MTAQWEATAERFCTGCRRWVPASSIKPRHATCYPCSAKRERELRRMRGDDSHLPPTEHHIDVLRSVARTGGYEEAAMALGISVTTVAKAMTTLYRRLGVSTLPSALYVLWLRDLWGES